MAQPGGTKGRVASHGRVFLVGAGPGDPGLITLRGVECLRAADVVIYDYLVNPAIVEHAPAAAERIRLGHHGAGRLASQQEINSYMVAAAREGKTVVRLKGGDPAVFGHAGDEMAALAAAGIPYEIVPGVTAATAAAGYAAIPITHGDQSSAVALVTGHQRADKTTPLDYGVLAQFPGTLVFYMGMTSAAEWSSALLARGKSPETPVAIVRRCSWPDQRIVRCTLVSVEQVIAHEKLRPPAVIVVGEVVARAPEVSWFAERPLFGTRIMVTRPRHEAGELCNRLHELGAEVIVQPAIEISPPSDWRPVDDALSRPDQFDWLVFSSANGVRYLLERLLQRGGDARRLGGIRMAAIGPGTADELARYRLRADLVPDQFRAESLADALIAACAFGGTAPAPSTPRVPRFLLARASRGREVLSEKLMQAGAVVEQIVVYRSSDVQQAEPEAAAALAAGRIDWITVTSSAIARSLVKLFGDDLRRSKLASISPLTSGVLRELGFEPAVEAAQYTMAGLVEAILGAHQ